MKAAGKKYEPVTYEGAGHGFMRAGEDPTNTVEWPRQQESPRRSLRPHDLRHEPPGRTRSQPQRNSRTQQVVREKIPIPQPHPVPRPIHANDRLHVTQTDINKKAAPLNSRSAALFLKRCQINAESMRNSLIQNAVEPLHERRRVHQRHTLHQHRLIEQQPGSILCQSHRPGCASSFLTIS